jgi:hypothetical protein
MLWGMLTVHLPADVSSEVQARALANGVSSNDLVAETLRRDANCRRVFGEILDVAGGDLDEDEVMALAVAVTRQARRERAAR